MRYAVTLQLMLRRYKRNPGSMSRSPKAIVQRTVPLTIETPTQEIPMNHVPQQQIFSPPYEQSYPGSEASQMTVVPPPTRGEVNAESIWENFRNYEQLQLPVWMSDQTLGGTSFQHQGIDAFLLPNDYLYPNRF